MAFAGDVDVLVNNAGSIPGGTLWDVDEAAWRLGWELKVFGYINLTRAMYPAMKQRGHGVILNNIGFGWGLASKR
jgi:NADP-dependent 3-hydroxy acid dehydrogenase YdfG